LPDSNGTDDWTLPVPATFVIGTDGTVALAHVDLDYRSRLEPADALAAVERLARRPRAA
jgi:peroxiredoxin